MQPVACLKDKWKPWVSVWIQGDRLSPPRALVIGEDDKEAANHRFAILNDPEGDLAWERLRAVGYGRFAQQPYPYQLWEPDDEVRTSLFTRGFLFEIQNLNLTDF